jgi:hypothetical protein
MSDNRRPYRARTPSGHDIPIPESVFQAIHSVQQENAATRIEVAGLRSDVTEIKESVGKIAAAKSQTMIDLAKILIPAVVAIVGGQRLLTPTPEPARIEVQHTPIDPRMAECSSLQPGTQAQSECFARVQAEIQSGKRPAP